MIQIGEEGGGGVGVGGRWQKGLPSVFPPQLLLFDINFNPFVTLVLNFKAGAKFQSKNQCQSQVTITYRNAKVTKFGHMTTSTILFESRNKICL